MRPAKYLLLLSAPGDARLGVAKDAKVEDDEKAS